MSPQGRLLPPSESRFTVDVDPRSRALRALSCFVVTEMPLDATLTEIAKIVTESMAPVAFAGMSLFDDDGRPTTAIFTDPESPEIDAAQYAAGSGPCLDAWHRSEQVVIHDIADPDAPYVEFRAAALAHGIRSTLSLPLLIESGSVGALNLYATTKEAFRGQDREIAEELAAVAGALIANSLAYWGVFETTEHLQAALHSRSVIEQAKGILMAETPGLGAEGAFETLKAASQRENTKLREIAARIVDRRS